MKVLGLSFANFGSLLQERLMAGVTTAKADGVAAALAVALANDHLMRVDSSLLLFLSAASSGLDPAVL